MQQAALVDICFLHINMQPQATELGHSFTIKAYYITHTNLPMMPRGRRAELSNKWMVVNFAAYYP